jgi:hypothetical protein
VVLREFLQDGTRTPIRDKRKARRGSAPVNQMK